MRELSRFFEKSGEGKVKLIPDDVEDMWHLYNLIAIGDTIIATTMRKIMLESATGSSSAERVHTTLSVLVQTIDFDSNAVSIRISGRVNAENKHVKLGAFHTIDIECHRALTLSKPAWDAEYFERLNFALDPSTDAEIGVVLMDEGLAHVFLIGRSLTLTRARIHKAIPRKGANALFNRDTAVKAFFDMVYRAMGEHLKYDMLKAIIIASPGYVKDEFNAFLNLQAMRQDDKPVLENKSKIVLCHASSGHKHALDEVFKRPEVMQRLTKTKAVTEFAMLDEFHAMMRKDDSRAIYGASFVKHACDMAAIEKLLITDSLFRSSDVEQRKKYVSLTEQAKSMGATVVTFSTQHVSGEQLDLMGGIAAILRFPLPSLDDVEPSELL